MGFDVSEARNNSGLGLVNMAERIHQVNGSFSADSRLNIGTKIREHVPVGGELLNQATIGVWYKPRQPFCH